MLFHEVVEHGECQVWAYRARSVTQQQCGVHYLAYFSALHDEGCLHTLAGLDEVVVNGAHSQQRRYGGAVLVDVTVAQYYVVHAFVNRRLCRAAQVLDALAQSARSLLLVEEHRQFLGVEALVADVAEYVELRVGYDRLWQAHHLAVGLVWCQYAAAHASDILGQRHHKLLSDRVDGWVCHLRELLAEVVEEYLRTVAYDSQRSVVAHRCDRLLTGCRHRHDCLFYVLLSESEGSQLAVVVLDAVGNVASALQVLQADAVCREPFAVRVRLGELSLDFAVVVYFAFLGVYEQNLARLQSAFAHDLAWLEVHHSDLARHYHHAAFSYGVAAWAQTVSVEHSAGIASVAEEQRRRSVPWLHEYAVVLVECFQVVAYRVLVVEALWHEYRHGLWQAQSAHHQELEQVVEARRVAHVGLDDRRDGLDVA